MKILLMVLPLLLRFVGIILDKNGASNATKQKVLDLAASAADDGLISVKAKDTFKSQKEKIEADIKKENSNGSTI